MKRSTKETVVFWEGKIIVADQKISEWEKSGLSREKFFQKEGLNRSTAGYWFRKLQREGGQEGFVEITPTEVISVSREGLKVTVRGKYTIEIGDNNFTPAVLMVLKKKQRLFGGKKRKIDPKGRQDVCSRAHRRSKNQWSKII